MKYTINIFCYCRLGVNRDQITIYTIIIIIITIVELNLIISLSILTENERYNSLIHHLLKSAWSIVGVVYISAPPLYYYYYYYYTINILDQDDSL